MAKASNCRRKSGCARLGTTARAIERWIGPVSPDPLETSNGGPRAGRQRRCSLDHVIYVASAAARVALRFREIGAV